jgi:hypothetical protein
MLAVAADYDGITSWINVVAVGSCCASVILFALALPLAWSRARHSAIPTPELIVSMPPSVPAWRGDQSS